ncbi:MAG TPA: glycosyltransferase [Candidatus Methylomirabilis sp.]|nr:glycosyltransferase [Candidatus Methylomirabilis sp.]
MAEAVRRERLLAGDDLADLEATGPAELLVGVVASNHAASVVPVVERAARGLAKHFPGQKSVVLVVDAGSRDGTPDAVREWKAGASPLPLVQLATLAGPPVEGRAIHAVLGAARRLEVRACALFDADLSGLAPDWVERLLQPVLREEADYASPAYTRTPPEGTLTTNLLAPMTRALYGKRIQQLLGGCLALSQAAVRQYLEADVWEGNLATHGIRMWLPTEALASDRKVVEVPLGRKIVSLGTREADLAATLVHTVGPLFSLMGRYASVWQDIHGSRPLPMLGDPPDLLWESREVHLDRMVRGFRLGLKDLLHIWEQIMPDETLAQLYPLGILPAEEFRLPPPLWARVVADFALAYHERRLPREHLLRALMPLYLGRVASFLHEARATPSHRLQDLLEAIGGAFESEKESLQSRWR